LELLDLTFSGVYSSNSIYDFAFYEADRTTEQIFKGDTLLWKGFNNL